jgi:hypothetical protein
MRPWLAFVIVVALAGCSNAPPSTEHGSLTASATSTMSGGPAPIDGAFNESQPLGLRFDASDCKGVGFALEGPSAYLTGNRPDDWPPATEGTLTAVLGEVIYGIHECQRFSWDQFERGPIWMAYEMHRDFVPPEACSQGDWTRRMFMQNIWFSDPELVDHARIVYGMPAALGQFTTSIEQQAGATIQTWQFGTAGGQLSTIAQPGHEPNFMGETTIIWRMYWLDGQAVDYVDLTTRETTPQLGPHQAQGVMAEPTIYATNMPTPEFVTNRSDLLPQLNVTAPISRFRDTQCQQPA